MNLIKAIVFILCLSCTQLLFANCKDSLAVGTLYLEASECRKQKDWDCAKVKYEKAIECYLELRNWKQVVNSYAYLSSVFNEIKSSVEAQNLLDSGIDTIQNLAGTDEIELSRLHYKKASLHTKKDELINAREEYLKSIDIIKRNKTQSLILASASMNLGNIYTRLGDYKLAEEYLLESDDIFIKLEESSRRIKVQNNLARIYKDRGEQAKEFACYEWILQEADENDSKQKTSKAIAAESLCDVYASQGNCTAAVQNGQLALKLYTELQADKKDDRYASALSSLAKAFACQKAWNKSEELFQESILVGEEFYNKEGRDLAKLYIEFGDYYKVTDKFDNALTQYQKAESCIQQPFDAQKLLALSKIGAINWKLYQQYNTIDYAKKTRTASLEALNQLQLLQLEQTSESQQFIQQNSIPIFERAIQTAYLLYTSTADERYALEALNITEQSKDLLLRQSLQQTTNYQNKQVPKNLLEKAQSIKREIAIAQLEQGNTTEKDVFIRKVHQLRLSLDSLETSLEKDYTTYLRAPETFTKNLSLAEIRNELLEPKEAIIAFFVGNQSIYAFVITEDDFTFSDLGDKTEILSKVQLLIQQIQSGEYLHFPEKDFEVYTKTANHLYSKLLQKPIANLAPTIHQLTIIPHEELSQLSFDMLLTQAVNTPTINYAPTYLPYLLNDFVINYAYSCKTLLAQKQLFYQKEPTKKMLGYAPIFDGDETVANRRSCSSTGKMSSLVHNIEEVEYIVDLVDGDSRLAEQASKAHFLEEAGAYSILHLATHACSDNTEPLKSKVFFADDAFIYLYEIKHLLLQAQMIVLSACDTGSGVVEKGEGFSSLARGFTFAGVPSVNMTLWPADDASSAAIMKYYYEELSQGLEKSMALSNAKKRYLGQYNNYKQHPYFWAAFNHIGYDEAVLEPSNSWGSPFLLGLALLAAIGLVLFFLFRSYPTIRK